MENATKKQMVEFINSRCRVKGKKIPKTKLNQLAESDLMKIITANEGIEKAFNDYIENENTRPQTSKTESCIKEQNAESKISTSGKAESNQALTEELIRLVNQLVEDPTSFLSIMEFKKFIENLPYGSVDFNTLSSLIDKVMEVDPGTAFLLLKYSTDQELFLQDKK